ncbi:hypothetical protein EJ08DRAFT_729693 [Tothia fuscella]|uniref:Uncharacterized protein n=1 Tax=Tothia fuscella TaxID=1048955 RepID=A0A9P4P1S0_9PEZI|nr:hypothetical protein EJ08DRAFT_729693 [Tothia fuscella]
MPILLPRQVFVENPNNRPIFVCDKSCERAYTIKYAIFLSLFGIAFLCIIVGYWHARKRIRNGLAPRAYHRWLAPSRNGPRQNDYVYYRPNPYAQPQGNGGYGMNRYGSGNGNGENLPVYSGDLPPTYQPGKGARREDGAV